MFFLTLGTILAISEWLKKHLKFSDELSRKLIHVSVGALVWLYATQLQTPNVIIFISLLFTLINAIVLKFNLLPAMQADRTTYGTVLYPLAIAISAALFWQHNKTLFYIAVWVLAVADALAAGVGQSVKKPVPLRMWYDKKSVQGALTMWGATALIIYIAFTISGNYHNPLPLWLISCVAGALIAISELISKKGSDNLSVALMTLLLLDILIHDAATGVRFNWAFLVSAVSVSVIVKWGWLTVEGGIATVFTGTLLYGLGGWEWTLPIVVFFITSSLLSVAGRAYKQRFKEQFAKSSRRDAHQVFANGGMALIIMILYYYDPQPFYYFMFLASLAAANADTWATELGVFSPHEPRMITTLQSVEKGRSGAVSWTGLLAAMAGSALIALTGYLFLPMPAMIGYFILVAASGFLASLVDSLLGATLQAQFRTANGKWTEIPGKGHALQQGVSFVTNDVVNFIAILSASLMIGLFLIFK
ncbi:MAG: DUF92 domain-containing protein [Calditrichaeota bacterium]|nr:MAG: DUF92 domain-containing protein [Calditrichota bacterium]